MFIPSIENPFVPDPTLICPIHINILTFMPPFIVCPSSHTYPILSYHHTLSTRPKHPLLPILSFSIDSRNAPKADEKPDIQAPFPATPYLLHPNYYHVACLPSPCLSIHSLPHSFPVYCLTPHNHYPQYQLISLPRQSNYHISKG